MTLGSRFGAIPALLIILAGLLLASPGVVAPASAQDKVAGHAVLIPSATLPELDGLSLQPLWSHDYGRFRWLLLDSADQAKLLAANIPHTPYADAGQLQIGPFSFDPLRDGPPPDAAAESQKPGFRLIQFYGPTDDAWLATLAEAGLKPLQYYPHHAYLVWSSPAQTSAIEALPFVRWQGPVQPLYKQNSDLDGREGIVENVAVFLYDDGRLAESLETLARLGRLLHYYPAQPDRQFYEAIIQIDAAQLDALAALDTVLWFGFASPEPAYDDEVADTIVANIHSNSGCAPESGCLNPPPVSYLTHLANLGVTGAGVTWAVVDSGADLLHPDLAGRIIGGYTFPGAPAGNGPGDDCTASGHGTHVAGIVAGDATAGYADQGYLYGLGVAPGANLFVTNSLCGPSWPPAGGWAEHARQAVLGGAVGGNNSWTTGEGVQHGYQSSERAHDILVRDADFTTNGVAEPYIAIFSAGNAGQLGLTAPKEAKNLIVVAASRNNRNGNPELIATFSSRGPAVDGRTVPTIAAPGVNVSSARRLAGGVECNAPISGTDDHYAFCTGTSMAAPHVSGALALATEWWRNTQGGDPSPAMAKALLVNSAVDMDIPNVPNIREGWGRVNVTALISPTAPVAYHDQALTLDVTGEQRTFRYFVAQPGQPLKITLAWSDAPGAVGANPALVNNLDLTVEVGGQTFVGNDFAAGWSATGGAPDAINNLENVYLPAASGPVTVTVTAVNLAGDGVPWSGDATDQDFALVCRNCLEQPDFVLDATPREHVLCAPATADYTLDVAAVLGFGAPVSLTATGAPPGASASFTPSSGVPPFASSFTVADTASAVPGEYTISLAGASLTTTHTTTVRLELALDLPDAPALVTPAEGVTGVPTNTVFIWNALPGLNNYTLEVATDPDFTTLVVNESVAGLSFTQPLAPGTIYYWRVRAANACGNGPASPIQAFRTVANLCQDVSPAESFESGTGGWTTGGTGPGWALSTARANTGATSMHAPDPDFAADQVLTSPAYTIPATALNATLHFWNYQEMESATAGCFDGGLLEIQRNGGTWDPVLLGLQSDPYDGPIEPLTGNPLSGRLAWCGEPQDWLDSTVNVTPYAGDTVQFRFRLGSDSSVGAEGWYIDDVRVEACEIAPESVDYSALAASYGIAWHDGGGALRLGSEWGADNSFAAGQESGDGIIFSENSVVGQTFTMTVTTNGAGTIGGWFDWNKDGTFSPGEQMFNTDVLTGTTPLVATIPSEALIGYGIPYRVRLFAPGAGQLAPESAALSPDGGAAAGEVNDGLMNEPVPTAVTFRAPASPRWPAPTLMLSLALLTLTLLAMGRRHRLYKSNDS